MKQIINYEDFEKIDIRSGTIIKAELNPKALKAAYILYIDFGDEIGIKTSSAQLTQNYSEQDLLNKQIVAIINFPLKRVAGVKSEVLVLATVCDKLGTLLLATDKNSINGSCIK